jgi:pimeloyl-ACP methyl ester carboxylesterase
MSKPATLVRRLVDDHPQEASMSTMTTRPTTFATSADGTSIAYEVTGSGPALVLVDGAMCHRAFGPARGLAAPLAGSFTVYSYDRRGRGESGSGSTPYAVQREVEDLATVIEATGGVAHVFGASSGATLALEAARQGVPMRRVAVYEAPFIVDDTRPPNDPRLPERVQQMVDDGRRADAVRTFLRTVEMPAPFVALMRFLPMWRQMTAIAHTLPYDLQIVVGHQQGAPLPAGYYDDVSPDTLVVAGGKSPVYMRNGQAAIAAAVPRARLESLPGQTHMIKAKVLAPVLAHFLRD